VHLSYFFAVNPFGIAGVCGLIPSLLNLPKLAFAIQHSPSNCIGSDAWRQAGLAVPPKEAVGQRWDGVLKHLREVRVHICMAESVPSSMHDLPKSPVTQSCSRRHFLPQINAAQIRAKHELLLSAPPAATLDCSALYDPLMLLSALEHASSSPAGSAFCCLRFCIDPCRSAAAVGVAMLYPRSARYGSHLAQPLPSRKSSRRGIDSRAPTFPRFYRCCCGSRCWSNLTFRIIL
jgi:hypothetical protein